MYGLQEGGKGPGLLPPWPHTAPLRTTLVCVYCGREYDDSKPGTCKGCGSSSYKRKVIK